MSVTFQSIGTVGVGSTSVTPGLPASLATGDGCLIQVVAKPDTATIATPAGWTLVGQVAGGGGTTGNGIGPTRQAFFFREKDAGWSTMPAITVTGGSASAALASRYTKTLDSWAAAATTATWGTGATTTNAAVTFAADPGFATGDVAALGYSTMDEAPTWSGLGLTIPGCTVASLTEQSEAVETTTGNDIGGMFATASISAGTSNGTAPSATSTLSVAGRGTAMLVRLRDVAATPLVPAKDSSSPAVVKSTATGTGLTTASFTPLANAAIVVGFTSDDPTNATGVACSNTGTAITWNLIAHRRTNSPSGADSGIVALWVGKTSASPGAITVTAGRVGGSDASIPKMLVVSVYNPTDVDPDDPIGDLVQGSFAASSTSVSASITPETTGGGVRLIWLDWNATGVPTALLPDNTDTQLVDAQHSAGQSTNVQLGKTVATSAGVAQTIGGTLLSASSDGNYIAYELRKPAGGTQHAAAGQVDAVTTTTGTAVRTTPAAGTVAASSTTSGAAASRQLAAGTNAAVSTTTGAATSKQGAAGTSAATSATTGAAAVVQPAAGTVAAVTTTSGAAERLGLQLPAAGQVDAVTTTSGEAVRTTPVAGTSAATSATSGSAASRQLASGTSTATSATTGAAVRTTPASGTVAAVSTTAGSAEKVAVQHPAAGTVAATSATSGSAVRAAPASGQVDAVTTTTGTAGPTIRPLAGTVAATSSTSGDATVLRPSSGTVAATSTTAGSAGFRHAVAGTVAATTTTSGAAGRGLPAAGTVSALSATIGAAAARRATEGVAAAVSATTAAVGGKFALAGTADTLSATLGAASSRQRAAGVVDVVVTTTADAALALPAAGQVDAVTTTSGEAILGIPSRAIDVLHVAQAAAGQTSPTIRQVPPTDTGRQTEQRTIQIGERIP